MDSKHTWGRDYGTKGEDESKLVAFTETVATQVVCVLRYCISKGQSTVVDGYGG